MQDLTKTHLLPVLLCWPGSEVYLFITVIMTMTAMFLFRSFTLDYFYCIVYIVSISVLSLYVCMYAYVCIMYYTNPATGCHTQ